MDTFVLGMVQVNTYLLWEENHVLIVDPGSKSHKLQETIDSQKDVYKRQIHIRGHDAGSYSDTPAAALVP